MHQTIQPYGTGTAENPVVIEAKTYRWLKEFFHQAERIYDFLTGDERARFTAECRRVLFLNFPWAFDNVHCKVRAAYVDEPYEHVEGDAVRIVNQCRERVRS